MTAVGGRPALPAITFRAAREDDIPRCAEVWYTATNHYVTALNQPPLPDDLSIISRLYVHLLSSDPERFVVAVTPDGATPDGATPGAERVVAFAVALQRDHVWFLSMLFVLPDVQLRGLGRELLARVLPPDGQATVRATATDSAQPISNALYSTYGPTADTGGLFQHQAPVIYRYESVEDLLAGEARGGSHPPLPGPGAHSPTERPDRSS